MRYYKSETNQSYIENEPHFFREDEIHEAIDNLVDEFFPITVTISTKREWMDNEYGEGEWTQKDWDDVGGSE